MTQGTWVSYGVRLAVHASSTLPWDKVCEALPPGYPAPSSGDADVTYGIMVGEQSELLPRGSQHRLYRNGKCIYHTTDAARLLDALQSDASWQVAVQAKHYMFIHAGAVTYEERGILLPGVSGAGKSTLVAQLLARGASYYSDEYAVVDSAGELHPFPCRLRLKDRPRGAWRLKPEEFGVSAGHGPAHVDVVAFPSYLEATSFRVQTIPQSQAALYLLQHMAAARLRPAQALAAAATTAKDATCLGLQYADSALAAETLIRVLTRHR